MRAAVTRHSGGAQRLLVHSESIFYAAKHLVPLAGSDSTTVPKKQQEANAVSRWDIAPGREWASLQSRKIPSHLSSDPSVWISGMSCLDSE